jgi:hypothetical protein
VAAEDQTVNTNDFKNRILNKEIDHKCRLRKQHEETINHQTSGCPILAKNEYPMRRNRGDTLTLFRMQSTGHCNDRQIIRAHTQKPAC